VADLAERDTFTDVRRSTETSALYAIELLQSDYHRFEYHQILLTRYTGYAFLKARSNSFVTL